jgi:inosine-uridine nucleoside N-ribohydrolase
MTSCVHCGKEIKKIDLPPIRKVLLITDIGRDIDDTLALLALRGYEIQKKIEVVGVVTCSGSGKDRAKLLRLWMNGLGFRPEIPLAVSEDTKFTLPVDSEKCLFPDGWDQLYVKPENSERKGGNLIVELARKHKKNLHILVIGPLTPLAMAVKYNADIVAKVAKIWIQGNAKTSNYQLIPDDIGYNIKVDSEASEYVFKHLNGRVNFGLVGKFAAYQVGLLKNDFQELDEKLGVHGMMTDVATKSIASFRKQCPKIFDRLYPNNDKVECLSYPYDALLVVAMVNEDNQDNKGWFIKHRLVNEHFTIGNEKDQNSKLGGNGVKNIIAVKTELMTVMLEGCRKFQSVKLSG